MISRLDSQKGQEWDDKLTRPLPGQYVDDDDWTSGGTVITEDSLSF